MARLKIEETAETLKITFDEEKAGKGAQTILKIIILTLLILPFLGLIFIGFDKALIGGFLLVYAAAYYFLRIYLWNAFGEEIIIIDNEKVSQHFNYGWFQEEDVNVLNNKNVQIIFSIDKLIELNENSEEVLDMESLKEEMKEVNLNFYKNEKEYFQVKTKILKQEHEELKYRILRRLK